MVFFKYCFNSRRLIVIAMKIRVWARNFQFGSLDTNWEFLSFGAGGFMDLIWRLRPVNSHASGVRLAFHKSYRESCTKLKISCIFHKKLTMSLKIAKFINKHLKVYMQEYNYGLKQQWLFLKYHDALLVSRKKGI